MKNLSIKARSLGGSGEKPSIINRRRLEEIGVLEGGEVPESVTGLIREFRPTHVLIIDAASAGHEPGTIFFIDKKKIVDEDITTHRIPLSRLVRYLEASIGCRVVLVGIEPADTGWGGSMSPAVREAAAALADQLAGLIQRWSRPSPYT